MNTWIGKLPGLVERFGWALSLFGFVAGWFSYVLVQRGEEVARLVALSVLIGWPWLLVQPFFMRWLGRRQMKTGKAAAALIPNLVTQSIQQEILFFILPFLIAATQLYQPGQVAITALIIAAALVSTIDPLYHRLITVSRVASLAFHALCSFLAALVILPLVVKIPLERSLLIALLFVLFWVLIVLPGILPQVEGWKRRLGVVLGMTAIPFLIWTLRENIPAAGISVTTAVMTSEVSDYLPGPVIDTIPASRLGRGVYAYAAIRAPMGLSQDIIFNWRHGDHVEAIPSAIQGGRPEGYRTYSMKENFPENSVGLWEVDILTAQGQVLERLQFTVTK